MFRTAMQPRFLALLGLVIVVVVLFGRLGLWQLNVSQHKDQRELQDRVASAPEAPVDDVLPPQTPITGEQVNRAVSATGRYDAAHQVQVVDRKLAERPGSWVVTPLVVDGTGARLAVVRGFVPDGAALPPAPAGTVTVHGWLQPQEGPPDEPRKLPAGQMQTVDVSSLVNVWGGDVYNAFVFAETENPAPTGAAAELTRVPPPVDGSGEIDWRNFAYAIQWWIFAAFAVYVWWRMVRDEHELRRQESVAGPGPGVDPDPQAPTGATSIPSSGVTP